MTSRAGLCPQRLRPPRPSQLARLLASPQGPFIALAAISAGPKAAPPRVAFGSSDCTISSQQPLQTCFSHGGSRHHHYIGITLLQTIDHRCVVHLSVLAAITHAPAADRLCRDISRRCCYLCLRCSYAAFAFATAALQHLPVARPLRTWSRGSFLKPRWRHSPTLLGRGHDCLIHQYFKTARFLHPLCPLPTPSPRPSSSLPMCHVATAPPATDHAAAA